MCQTTEQRNIELGCESIINMRRGWKCDKTAIWLDKYQDWSEHTVRRWGNRQWPEYSELHLASRSSNLEFYCQIFTPTIIIIVLWLCYNNMFNKSSLIWLILTATQELNKPAQEKSSLCFLFAVWWTLRSNTKRQNVFLSLSGDFETPPPQHGRGAERNFSK